MKPSRFTALMILVLLAFFSTTACALTNVLTQTFSPGPVDTPPPPRFQEEKTQAAPAPVKPELQVPTQEILPFYQAGDRVQFPVDALEGLDSYRSQLNLRSVGQAEDETERIRELEILEERVRQDNAAYHRIRGDGIGGEDGALAFYRIDDQVVVYLPDRDETCMLFDSGDQQNAFTEPLDPHEIFTSFEIQDLIAVNDEVNGVPAQRYSVQSVDLTLGSGDQAMGEIWIAQDGGTIVRFQGEARGEFMLSDQAAEGTLHWDYQLTQINQLEEIVLPAACLEQQAAAGFPIPENAESSMIFGGFISFESLDSPLAVSRFYRERLPQDGWEITSEENFDDFFQIQARKNAQTAQVSITGVEDGTAVVIIIEE